MTLFRRDILGKERNDGSLRIHYKYDGWPNAIVFVRSGIDTKGKQEIPIPSILQAIEIQSKEAIECKNIKFGIFDPLSNKIKYKDVSSLVVVFCVLSLFFLFLFLAPCLMCFVVSLCVALTHTTMCVKANQSKTKSNEKKTKNDRKCANNCEPKRRIFGGRYMVTNRVIFK